MMTRGNFLAGFLLCVALFHTGEAQITLPVVGDLTSPAEVTVTEVTVPEDAILSNGSCSINKFIACAGIAECIDVDNEQFYCQCPESAVGDGLKAGTGCTNTVFSCTKNDECHVNANCTEGLCTCKNGFDGNGNNCTDIDECAEDKCVANSVCRNEPGSYSCACKPRFESIDGQCIHKCTVDRDCHQKASCVNQECVCDEGYAGDGVNNCDDKNECLNDGHDCNVNALCLNTNGSFECTCNNGFAGNGVDCEELPKTCDELYRIDRSTEDGVYEIDTDGNGPAGAIKVRCEFRNRMGITMLFPLDQSVQKSPDGGAETDVEYPATPDAIQPLLNNSEFCSQQFWAKCDRRFNLIEFTSWQDLTGTQRKSWGTLEDGKCACGVLGRCKNADSPCNCDGKNGGFEIDTGYVIDKSKLPATRVSIGSTNRNTKWIVGPLRCGPKPIDILKDCDEIRKQQKIKDDGPQLIDVDGPNGELDPVLVYCDMSTYPGIGVTVVDPGEPEVTVEETGPNEVKYNVPGPVLDLLVSGSVHCEQPFEYECQQGKQTVSVGVGSDNRTSGYLPGGINQLPGSCGCGVTQTCDDPEALCNCAIDDGMTRKDIGVQVDREALPIVSVNVELDGEKKGAYVLGPLRCSSTQFGIESNCEKYRSLGQQANYTYLIDPDGKPTGEGDNVAPFHAQCVMQVSPPMGITIIQHENRNVIRLGDGDSGIKLTYPYVSPEQLDALKETCTYVQQSVKLSCNKFALHPPGGNGNDAFWYGFGQTSPNYYWSGNGSFANCMGADGSDECQCDSSETSAGIMVDEGFLTNKEVLPFGGVNFKNADIDGTGYVDMELGPFKCFEVSETCAAVLQKAKDRKDAVPQDGAFTVDPDGSGPVEAFEVDCNFPVTKLDTPTDGEKTNDGPDPVTECFDIDYKDGVGNSLSQDQVIALVEASNGNCKQTLSLTCTNAPISGMISFKTCGKSTQTGWAGSGGADSCKCGLTGTCEGGLQNKCNCDIEDGKTRSDSGTIVDNERLPICQVCITLNGTSSTGEGGLPPSRSASFEVSDLICSKYKLGVSKTCEKARRSSTTPDTIYVKASPEPVPVYCDLRPFPPIGVMQVFPENPETEIPPNTDYEVVIVYKTLDVSLLVPLIEKFDYCTQTISLDCESASLEVEGQYGWYSRDGQVQSYWTQQENGPCAGQNGDCNCNLPGFRVDSGVIVDQSALPVSKISFKSSPGTRTLTLGPLECFDVKKDCYDIMNSGNKVTSFWANHTYVIDADGPGPLDPFLVTCEFREDEDNAITIAFPVKEFPYSIPTDGSVDFELPLQYTGATPEQLNELARRSKFCMQGIQYECKESRIGEVSLADGSKSPGFGLADDITTIGCACGKLGTCGSEEVCRCDNMGPMGDFDQGVFTAKDQLPILSTTFPVQTSDNAVGKVTVEPLKCSPKPADLPKNCHEANEMGMSSGEILIYPTEDMPPFLVFCDMSIGDGVARVKPVPDPDNPVDSGDNYVPYNGLSEDQIRALVLSSDFCYQPVLIDCLQAKLLSNGAFYWTGGDGLAHRYWGSGDPDAQTCTCGAEGMCGGEGGKDDMSRRKCNCDIGDATWRQDGGVLRVKEHLPVMSYKLYKSSTSQANITLGDLYCGMEEIDLPVCRMEFDDCGEKSVCEGKSVSRFECHCIDGWQGRENGRSINDVWANGRQCFDDNECSFLACPYSAECENLPGDFNCTCKEGYTQPSKTVCLDIDECKEGTHDCDENARCENTDGSFVCRCNRGYVGNGKNGSCEAQGQCACFGDPHCLSYDQKWLHFMGLCEYVMTRDNCGGGDPNFQVVIKDWSKESVADAAWVKEVVITFGGVKISLLQEREIRLNGETVLASYHEDFRVYDTGRQVVFETTTPGIVVTWDGRDTVQVFVGGEYQGKLCGLCGNYNNDLTDDWTIGPGCPNEGTLTANNNQFTTSWALPPSEGTPPRCDRDCDQPASNSPKCRMPEQMAAYLCNILLNQRISIFAACIPLISPSIMEGMFMTCNIDMCRSPETGMDNLCVVGEKLATECINVGVPVPLWENANGVRCGDTKCGENMRYSNCGGMATTQPGPSQTCVGYMSDMPPIPSSSCQRGCFCKEGFYKENDKCVPADECGCSYTNKETGAIVYMKPGEKHVNTDCGSYIVCSEGGNTTEEQLVCGTNAECITDDETGVHGCFCAEGFIGDGENCEPDPCFNNTCKDNQECKDGECLCKMGFTADCELCVDIDECGSKTHNCTKYGQKCRNTLGGFTCDCEEGYVPIPETKSCYDLNECMFENGGCPEHSQCKNTMGGFKCVCCAGFIKNAAECVPDGSGLATYGNQQKCCSCFGDSCDKPGKVCGSDGKTYNSEKELVIIACKNNENVVKSYDGRCVRDTCDGVECENPNQKCSIDQATGKGLCSCPECVESESETVIESVCSSLNIKFKSMCDFEKYSCGVANTEVTVESTGKDCDESLTGYVVTKWSPWSECSVSCGTGFVSRTRASVINATDSNGNPLKETAIALCYNDVCADSKCVNVTCPGTELCVETNTTSGTKCICPDCNNRGEDPICGRLGNFVKTYKNLCELERAACIQKMPMTLVENIACEADPVNCTKKANWGIIKLNDTCRTMNMDWGQCGGGCGLELDRCCTPVYEEADVDIYCSNVRSTKTMQKIVRCDCKPIALAQEQEQEQSGSQVGEVVPYSP